MAKKSPLKEIALATGNLKKLEEISRITGGMGITLRTLTEFPDCPEVVEDADTFEGNALKKAREISAHTGLAALADDSGLEVDALDGSPGVFSARYAGQEATDADNVRKLLAELSSVTGDRSARFRCVIALALPDGTEEVFDGSVEGRIGTEEHGHNGFGYDPVFFPEGHERTFAEMDASEKDSMSHRGT
jgi:XTP/dITP diphosphohydrolase